MLIMCRADPLDLDVAAYNYYLPPELIAQNPAVPRDSSRLLVVHSDRRLEHSYFYNLANYLRAGDLLVFNDSKVIPARLYGQKTTGAEVEVLLLEDLSRDRWLCLVRPGKRLTVGAEIIFPGMRAKVVNIDLESGVRELQFTVDGPHQSFWEILMQIGQTPLPPYIINTQAHPDQYQTVYAQVWGSCAAPTAGLHFTEKLLAELQNYGVRQAFITLHVGLGTFRPVEVQDITKHNMHSEWIAVSEAVINAIKTTKASGGRVIGVGTTTARALETAVDQAYYGKTDLMIYPSYQWRVLDGLITNFHLPKSTLLMLVSSFLGTGGRKFLLETVYPAAIQAQYRFYSFGDAMLIWADKPRVFTR
ncbi:MAG: tRNA preQ1(34) S-adenosylmethionine ribosyltransferase-isomerase QueA [Pseudanabaenaceae cyanobacterium]